MTTTETFISLRSLELWEYFRWRYKRKWRYIIAKRLRRRDSPRWLVASVGKHKVTLAQLLPVEKLALEGDFAAWLKCCRNNAADSNGATAIPPNRS